MATQRKCWELLTTEVILVDQKWHRAIITGQSRSRKGGREKCGGGKVQKKRRKKNDDGRI